MGVDLGVYPLVFGRSGQLSQNKFFDPSTHSIMWVTIIGLVGDYPRVVGDHPRVCGPRGLERIPQGLGKGCTHVSSSMLDFTSVHFLLVGDHPWWVTILGLVAARVWKGVYA